MKTIREGEIIPYGLSRRIGPDTPAEYILRVPVWIWWRTDVLHLLNRTHTGWWVLNAGVLLGFRPQMVTWWSVL